MKYDVIIDCYTDEPSGLGVPPYLSVHSRYIAGVLKNKNIRRKRSGKRAEEKAAEVIAENQ